MGNEVVERARALLGVPFRHHGRDPSTGLDCVGLIACAIAARGAIPTGYPLRGGNILIYSAMIDMFQARHRGARQLGDTLLITVGPQQFHLGIWTGASLIHAHAGLRRVVETPGEPIGEIVGLWHFTKD